MGLPEEQLADQALPGCSLDRHEGQAIYWMAVREDYTLPSTKPVVLYLSIIAFYKLYSFHGIDSTFQ